MRNILSFFDVFSKRPEAAAKPNHAVPETTRNRILMWCGELFNNSRMDLGLVGKGNENPEFWDEIHRRLLVRKGTLDLSLPGRPTQHVSPMQYVLNCPGEEFLDFIEDIFSVDCFMHAAFGGNKLVDEVNGILRIDNLPYHVTQFVTENVQEPYGQHGGLRNMIYTRALPKIIMKENEVLHAGAIAPALFLLQNPIFLIPNREFLSALEDYRKGDIGDCLTKCGSAFESVLKVICGQKKWPYSQNDPASTLIKTVLANTTLDSYFEPLLMIVATIRNRLSTAHGAGSVAKQPTAHIAQYALNVTASAILLLAKESGLS